MSSQGPAGSQPKVALVTGSSRGIGRAIVLRLARAGASVIVNAREDSPGAEAVLKQAQALGAPATVVMADVSRSEDVKRLVNETLAAYGRVDILVNNAGVTRDGLVVRMSEQQWDEALAVSLRGAFLCTREVLPAMLRQRWGRIISISSVVALAGNPGQANYAAAKAGLIGFTKSLAREVASRHITANIVAPGFIETDMTQRLAEAARQKLLHQIPMGSFGTPDDVAEAVVFLASEQAGYITGHVLNVDGGMVMP